jgi:prepilin-type processing-associated H-X9-DG protein
MRPVVTVLIIVVGLLVFGGLFIAAVPRWRSNADRARCQDNLRRICKRYLLDEAQATEAYPAGTVVVADRPADRRLSWVVPGLTRLGHESVARAIDLTAAWDTEPNRTAGTTFLTELVCPAIVGQRPTDVSGPLHYPGMAGVGADAATKPPDARGAGLFRYDAPTRVADVKDGLSNTLMLAETAEHPGPWIAGGPPSVRPLDAALRPYIGPGRPFGGAHSGGANTAFADGSGRCIADGISPRVLELLAGIADGGRADDSQ